MQNRSTIPLNRQIRDACQHLDIEPATQTLIRSLPEVAAIHFLLHQREYPETLLSQKRYIEQQTEKAGGFKELVDAALEQIKETHNVSWEHYIDEAHTYRDPERYRF